MTERLAKGTRINVAYDGMATVVFHPGASLPEFAETTPDDVLFVEFDNDPDDVPGNVRAISTRHTDFTVVEDNDND